MSSLVVDYFLRGRWLVMIGAPEESLEEISNSIRAHWPGEVIEIKLRGAEAPEPVENETR